MFQTLAAGVGLPVCEFWLYRLLAYETLGELIFMYLGFSKW